MGDARVTFDLRRGTISVEGPADDLAKLFEAARLAAPSLKQVSIVSNDFAQPTSVQDVRQQDTLDLTTPPSRIPSMRDFARQFAFDNTSERIAVLAYYSSKIERKPTFSVREMSDWFGLCGFKKPKQMPIAMSDARRKYGYVESKGRDQWSLATGGENLVLEFIESNPNGG